jgi:hypothetical protein
MRIIMFVLTASLVSACGMLPEKEVEKPTVVKEPTKPKVVKKDQLCWFDEAPPSFAHNCDLHFWTNVWLTADATPWVKRKQLIEALGNTEADRLNKYFLTLPTDTPYQDKLRAQLALDEVSPMFSDSARLLFNTIAVKPNKQQMELESAMSVLSKENARNVQALEALRAELDAQQQKLEELLQIEATLMDKSRSNQQ